MTGCCPTGPYLCPRTGSTRSTFRKHHSAPRASLGDPSPVRRPVPRTATRPPYGDPSPVRQPVPRTATRPLLADVADGARAGNHDAHERRMRLAATPDDAD